ncbi:hypothetical protein KIPB_007897, partial [Kipferlia bialata]
FISGKAVPLCSAEVIFKITQRQNDLIARGRRLNASTEECLRNLTAIENASVGEEPINEVVELVEFLMTQFEELGDDPRKEFPGLEEILKALITLRPKSIAQPIYIYIYMCVCVCALITLRPKSIAQAAELYPPLREMGYTDNPKIVEVLDILIDVLTVGI